MSAHVNPGGPKPELRSSGFRGRVAISSRRVADSLLEGSFLLFWSAHVQFSPLLLLLSLSSLSLARPTSRLPSQAQDPTQANPAARARRSNTFRSILPPSFPPHIHLPPSLALTLATSSHNSHYFSPTPSTSPSSLPITSPIPLPLPTMSGLRDMSRRQDSYKNKGQFKQDELRRRREEAQVEIRRQKREESMAKRRNLSFGGAASGAESEDDEVVGAALDTQVSRSALPSHCSMRAVGLSSTRSC